MKPILWKRQGMWNCSARNLPWDHCVGFGRSMKEAYDEWVCLGGLDWSNPMTECMMGWPHVPQEDVKC
jgi:hypothetical protein